MKRLFASALLLVVFLSLTSCTQAPAPAQADSRAADQKAITEVEAAWAAAYKSKDIEKIVSYYVDDAIFMDAGVSGEIKGKEAIRAGLKMFLDDTNFALAFTPTGVEGSKGGDLGFSHGTYTATMTDRKTQKPITETGKYVCAYRKQSDGTWKSILDINTPDPPKQQ
jgi:uncharacterized protein (TIGR02246 family)